VFNRRDLVVQSSFLALAGTAAAIEPQDLPRKAYDPLGPPDKYWDSLYDLLVQPNGIRNTISFLWSEYERSGDREIGEWAIIYGYLWWRGETENKAERIKVAKLGGAMCGKFLQAHPDSQMAQLWQGIYAGFLALSRGILDSLHFVPQALNAAETVIKRDPGFFYGIALILKGRIYFKAPAFPLSKGNLDKSEAAFERARPYAEKLFAPWYMFYAELHHIRGEPDKRDAKLAAMREEVQYVDKLTKLNHKIAKIDAANLMTAIKGDTYDRYTYDVFLEQIDKHAIR